MKTNGLFIGLGFQKCATTQITMRISVHPRIWPHPVRELRYWTRFYRNDRLPVQSKYARELTDAILKADPRKPLWTKHVRRLEAWTQYAQCPHRGPEDYVELFSRRSPDAWAFGEISPEYALMSEREILETYESLGRPKLFVIMREPIARALSAIHHEHRLKPASVQTIEGQIEFLNCEITRQMSDYPRVIRALRSLPDQRNIGFFFFEDFTADMESFFREFCAFLNVPYDPVLVRNMPRKSDHRLTLSPEVREVAAAVYGPIRQEVERLLGRVPDAWSVPAVHPQSVSMEMATPQ